MMVWYEIKSGKTGKFLDYESGINNAKENCIRRIFKNPNMILLIEKDGVQIYRIVKERNVIVFRNIQTGKRTEKKINDLKTKVKVDTPRYIAVYYDEHGTFGTLDHARKEAVGLYAKHHTSIPICVNYIGTPYGTVDVYDGYWEFTVNWTGKCYRFDPKTGKTIKRK